MIDAAPRLLDGNRDRRRWRLGLASVGRLAPRPNEAEHVPDQIRRAVIEVSVVLSMKTALDADLVELHEQSLEAVVVVAGFAGQDVGATTRARVCQS